MAATATPAAAVIPGLAPALFALLPQILLVAVLGLTLVFSPRAWWRLLVACARRPRATLAAAAAVAFAIAGAIAAARLFPAPAPGAEISERTALGDAYGDARAAGFTASAQGPIGEAEALACALAAPIDASAGPAAVASIVAFADDVVVVEEGRRRLARIALADARVRWRLDIAERVERGGHTDARIATAPLAIERVSDAGARRSALAVVVGCGGAALGTSCDRLLVIDGDDASALGEAPLPGRAAGAAALVDGRVVVALESGLVCFRLDEDLAPRLVWTRPRPPRPLAGLAGDEFGRVFVLDAEALGVHALGGDDDADDDDDDDDDGAPGRELARFEPGTPRRLALRDGIAYVLARPADGAAETAGARGGAAIHRIDPALSGEETRGARARFDVEAPLDDAFFVAGFGIVVTSRDAIAVYDAARGALRARIALDAPAACPAAGAASSCLALLADGSVLRFVPALDRIEWRRALPGLDVARGAAIIASGDRALVAAGTAAFALVEPPDAADSPWSQWRAGPARLGSGDASEMPLQASVLWRRPLASGAPARFLDAIAAGGGWIVASSAAPGPGEATTPPARRFTIERVALDGGALGAVTIDGAPRGIVRQGEHVIVAVAEDDGGARLRCYEVGRGGSSGLVERFSTPVPALGPPPALAVSRDAIVVALDGALAALSLDDGRWLWRAREATGAAAPLVVRGRIIAPSADRRRLLAFDLRSGAPLWSSAPVSGAIVGAASARGAIWLRGAGENGEDLVARCALADGTLADARPAGAGGAGASVDSPEGDGAPSSGGIAGGIPGGIAVGDEDLALFDASGEVRLLSIAPGGRPRVVLERAGEEARPRPAPIAGLGAIIVADGARVRCIDTLGMETIWELDAGAPVRWIGLEGGRALAATDAELIGMGAE